MGDAPAADFSVEHGRAVGLLAARALLARDEATLGPTLDAQQLHQPTKPTRHYNRIASMAVSRTRSRGCANAGHLELLVVLGTTLVVAAETVRRVPLFGR